MKLRRYTAVVLLVVLSLCPLIIFRAAAGPDEFHTSSHSGAAPGQQATPTPDPNDPIVRIKEEGMNGRK